MKCIFHKREARVIYVLLTERQPVIYWATNHLLARLDFNFNAQEMKVQQVYPSDVASFLPLLEKKSPKNFDCSRRFYMYFISFRCEKTTLLHLTL